MSSGFSILDERVKLVLEKIRNRISKLVGREVELREILEVMVKYFNGRECELANYICGVRLPLSESELNLLLDSSIDWGVETSREEIDRQLYGGIA